MTITWLTQMGLQISTRRTTILVDYFASDDPGRLSPAPVALQDVKGVDAFLGTHDHIDHIDRAAWRIWKDTNPNARFIFPAAHTEALLSDGIPPERLKPIDVGETVIIGDMSIRATPAAHEFLDRDAAGRCLYLQYVIEGEGKRVYHAGDTLRYEGMLAQLRAFGPIDAALLPINGRDAWRYRNNIIGNMTFQEAADLAGELDIRLPLPGHWDLFAGNTADPRAFADYLSVKYHITAPIPAPLRPIEL